MQAWTRNEAASAHRLRVFGRDGTGGVVGFWRATAKPIDQEPIVFFGSEGVFGVVARDLADFLVLFASGIGPLEAVENQVTTGKPRAKVKIILLRH